LDDHVKEKSSSSEDRQNPEHEKFWQLYLTNKIVRQQKPLSEREDQVQKAAEHLCRATGDDHQLSLRDYVHTMCYVPWRVLQRAKVEPPQPWDVSRHLLQAAIINGCTEVVNDMLKCADFASVLGCYYTCGSTETWASPLKLVGEFGRLEVLDMHLNNERFSRKFVRRLAFETAIRRGQLDLIKHIFDPKWGPNDLFGRIEWDSPTRAGNVYLEEARFVRGKLINGTLHSSLADFSAQLFAFFETCATTEYPIGTKKPSMNDLLNKIAGRRPERVDVATWLLDNGATRQPAQPPEETSSSQRQARYGIELLEDEPLQRAFEGGNEKIVHLLLHRGIDPAIIDFTINFKMLRYAVKHGRFSMLRLLVEHGLRIDEHELAMLSKDALEAEHLAMHQYFLGFDQNLVDEAKETTQEKEL
jgi:hypothetical protein